MNKNLQTQIKALKLYVEKNEIAKLKSIANSFLPADIAIGISSWEMADQVSLIKVLDLETAADIIHSMDTELQVQVVKQLDSEEIRKLFSELDSDEAVDIIEELDEEHKQEVLDSIDGSDKKDINRILKYEEKQAGYHMSLNYVKVREDLTTSKALTEVKKQIKKDDAELAGNVYVIDEEEKLLGRVPIEELLIAKTTIKIEEIMEPSPSLLTTDNISKLNEYFEIYGEESIPLTTTSNKLVGIVEPQDILEAINEYTNKSIIAQAAVGAEASVQYRGYMKTSSFNIFKSRVTWILALLFIGLVTQVIITAFQLVWADTGYWTAGNAAGAAVGSMVISTAFATALSVASSINDSAGNTGSQSSAVIIEALAMGEIGKKDTKKVLMKEVNAGLWIGTAVAIGSYARTYLVWALFGQLNGLNGQEQMMMFVIASIAAVSFLVSIVFGNFIGAALPLLGNKYNWNSAVISGPVSTTIIDIFVFALYLGLTTAVFVPLANSGYFETAVAETLVSGAGDIQAISQIWNI